MGGRVGETVKPPGGKNMKEEKVCVWIRDRQTGETIVEAVDVEESLIRDLEQQYRGNVFEVLIPSVANSILY